MAEGSGGEESPEFFQEVVGEATGTGTQFEDVEGMIGVNDLLPVAQKAENDFGIGVSNKGIAGDVVGDGVVVPGVDALLGEELPLELPEERSRKGLIRLQDSVRKISWGIMGNFHLTSRFNKIHR